MSHNRKQHGEIAAVGLAFVSDSDAVMAAVKARADQQPVADRAETEPHVGVREALDHAADDGDHDELAGLHADDLRNTGEPDPLDSAVEQMIAVVRPEAHHALAVVQAVQSPPDAEAVLQPVPPVISEIQYHDINANA